MKIGKLLREQAARMCSQRASAEAAGIQLMPRGDGHAFTPQIWPIRAQKLGYAAFMSVLDDGASPREMAGNWAEAEARLRTGEYPTADVMWIPGTRATHAQSLEYQRRYNESNRRAAGAGVRGRYKPRKRRAS